MEPLMCIIYLKHHISFKLIRMKEMKKEYYDFIADDLNHKNGLIEETKH